MIVMQYRYTLPASYDMAIIEQRIAQNGARLDGFPGLLFKAYLYARVDRGALENRYAPLYLWRDADALRRFLYSPGFAALTRDFGWPVTETWLTLHAPTWAELATKRYARITIGEIPPHSDLPAMALSGMLCAWDVSRWRLLQVDFSDEPPVGPNAGDYRIGYLAGEQRG